MKDLFPITPAKVIQFSKEASPYSGKVTAALPKAKVAVATKKFSANLIE